MFRGKESLNRIELSRLVQDLLNFALLGSLRLWGGGRWVGGVRGIWGQEGVSPTHAHTCACTHMHIHTCIHVWKLQMAADMEASMFSMISMFNIHVCVCVHACACVCVCVCMGHSPTHPYPLPPPCTHPPPPRGWTPRISKNSITLELIKIFQFRLKI